MINQETNIEATYLVEGQNFEEERALYNSEDAIIRNCTFKGEKDGESPLKESKDISVEECEFSLRYALWHVKNGTVYNSKFSDTARAPFWYDENIKFLDSESKCVKIFRECKKVIVQNSKVVSEEPFWCCDDVVIVDSDITGFYAFFNSKKVRLNHINFTGKYSFQYNKKLEIIDSNFDTKDAFWHCDNVVVRNSVIKGEYIGWYSKNMTFINCKIESHQPFCYCKNLKLIDCEMPNCDLAFENSTVEGSIIGKIDSIKNPIHAKIKVGEIGEFINDSPLHKVNLTLVK